MEMTYFFYQFIPSYAQYLGSMYGREPVKVPAFDLPEVDREPVISATAYAAINSMFGGLAPGLAKGTLIDPELMIDNAEIADAEAVYNMLKSYGKLKPQASIVGDGLKITLESLKDWCRETVSMQTDSLKTAILNAPAAFAGANATAIALNLNGDVYQRSKDLAKLLANNHISMDVDIDKTIEVEYDDIDSLNESIGNALYQIGLVTANTLMISPSIANYRAINGFLGRSRQNAYMVYIRNTINDKILPYLIILGGGTTYGGDSVEATVNNFTLDISTNPQEQYDLFFSLKAHLNNTGGALENLQKVYNLRMQRQSGLQHRGVPVDVPYDGYSENVPLFTDPEDSGSYIVGDPIVDDYIESVYKVRYQGVGTSDFFSGMSAQEVLDPNSYEVYNPLNNSKVEDHEVYAPVWDPNIKDKLILDEYDVASVNDDTAPVDRAKDKDRTIALDPAALDELAQAVPYAGAIPNIADILFPTLGVYPWDLDEQQTLTTVPLTKAQAGENIADKMKDDDLYVGTPDAKLVSATGAYGLFTIYKVSAGNLSALGAKLWSQDFIDNFHPFKNDPSEALISLIGYPMDISAASGSSDIICGNYNCSPASGNIVSDLFQDHSMGSIVLPEKFGNFMDYAPYTKVSMYLPFVGLVDLDADEVMGSTIKVDYRVELLTGTAVAKVTVIKGALNATLYQYTCNVGFTLPLSASDFSRTYTSLMTGAGTLALGAMSGNPAMLAGGVASMAQSVASAKPDINKTGGMSGNSGMCGNMNAYVIIDTVVPDKPGGYDKLKGLPANQFRQLGQMTGFVKLNEFQLNNISATDEEKAEIDRLLRSGVIV